MCGEFQSWGLAAPFQHPVSLTSWPQGRMARAVKEHKIPMVQNMMSNHTDMQEKYYDHSYAIYLTQSQYKAAEVVTLVCWP